MKADPNHAEYVSRWAEIYERNNYDEGLTGYFLTKSHQWSEHQFNLDMHFSKVLEVGAGTAVHIKFVKHTFDEYWITDLNPPMLDKIGVGEGCIYQGKVLIGREDATSLSFPNATFDRVIAAHILEHLYRPHEVLREWVRVLKPGGMLSLVLPCDPGLVWRLGRYAFARRKFLKAGIDYDYWMAREHVNPINNLVSFIHFYFDNFKEEWLPFRIPSIDLNLFYIAHVHV